MKTLQKLTLFNVEGMYVVDDEIDANKNSVVFLKEEFMNSKVFVLNRITAIDVEKDVITLEDFKNRTFKRDDVLRVLGRVEMTEKVKAMFKEGDVVEVGETRNANKSSKYLQKGDICTVKDHYITVELISDEISKKPGEWSWKDKFEARVINVTEFEKKSLVKEPFQLNQIVKLNREQLQTQMEIVVSVKCKCCGHEMY